MSTRKNTNRTARHFATSAPKHFATPARKPRGRKALVVGAALVLALGGAGGAFFAASAANAAPAPTTVQTKAPEAMAGATNETATAWIARNDAGDAARAAGFDLFGAPEIKVAGTTFSNPSFAAISKMAQAIYKTGPSTLTLRKAADGATESTAAVRTHDLGVKWDQEVDGITMIACGDAEGEAVVVEWADGGFSYGLTLEGGKAMSADDVAGAVRAVRDANAEQKQQAAQPAQQQAAQPAQQQAAQPKQAAQAEQKAEQAEVEYVSKETAIANAIDAVGLGQPNESHAKLKTDDGAYYAVTLEYADGERVAAVNAITGAVINVSGKTATSDKLLNGANDNQSDFYSNYISADAAVSAALRAAAYPADDVAYASATLDDSTGTPYYTVSITMNGGETLTCTVDAYSSVVTSC